MGFIRFIFRKVFGMKPRSVKCGGEIKLRYTLAAWSRNEIIDAFVDIAGYNKSSVRVDWFLEYRVEDHENKRLRNLLKSRYHNDHELNRAIHMSDLEERNRRLKEEVRSMQLAAHRHNLEAYATGLIVNCTGCDAGQPFEGKDLTEERVKMVEQLARRLRTWLNTHSYRNNR